MKKKIMVGMGVEPMLISQFRILLDYWELTPWR
jgi:hypothetical protein